MTRILTLALAASLLLVGCAKNIQNNDAVLQGLKNHLQKKDFPLANMDIKISKLEYRGKEADAQVTFTPKGMPQQAMDMKYTLEQKGNEWVVKGKPEGGMGHTEAPAGMPPAGGGAMPPNHPPTAPGAMPDRKQ